MSEHTECALCGAAAAAKVLALFPGEEQAVPVVLCADPACLCSLEEKARIVEPWLSIPSPLGSPEPSEASDHRQADGKTDTVYFSRMAEEQAEAHSLMAEEAEHALPAVQKMAEEHAEAQDRILKQQAE